MTDYKKVAVPESLRNEVPSSHPEEEGISDNEMLQRKGLKDYWSKFKTSLIDLFKEEEDHAL